VLYVDDESLNLKLFEINFGKRYNIISAHSGFEGLSILKSNPEIRVVISDMRMPGMNGIEFIELAKKEFPEIDYFLLTAYGLSGEILNALNEKLIKKYFSKPFRSHEIESSIEETIAKKLFINL
jgi:two-component system, response regulator, stage 0 sporulation protein F